MREKLLEKKLKKPLTPSIRKNIEKRLNQLKKDMSSSALGQVTYHWSKDKKSLFVKTGNLDWTMEVSKDKKIIVWVEVPFLLLPFVTAYKNSTLDILEKEIGQLMVK